jgi:hypothetical protein
MKYQIVADLAIKKIEATLFILDRKNSILHSFNETGTFLWELLQSNLPAQELGLRLADEFDVGLEQAQRDVDEFLNMLEVQKLIVLGG